MSDRVLTSEVVANLLRFQKNLSQEQRLRERRCGRRGHQWTKKGGVGFFDSAANVRCVRCDKIMSDSAFIGKGNKRAARLAQLQAEAREQ